MNEPRLNSFNKKNGLLLPKYLNDKRDKTIIAARFPAPIIPLEKNFIPLDNLKQNLTEFQHFQESSKPFLLQQINQNLGFFDKPKPHSLFELMVMQSGYNQQAGFFDLPEINQQECLKIFHKFVQYSKSLDLTPIISFSYDPHTTTRPPSQSVKRFHAHLVARSKQEINDLSSHKAYLHKFDTFYKRRVIDEFSIVAGYVLAEIYANVFINSPFKVYKPFEIYDLPNMVISLSSWDELEKSSFYTVFKTMHFYITEIMSSLFSSSSSQSDLLQTFLNYQNKFNFSTETLDLVKFFINKLKLDILSGKDYKSFQQNSKILEHTVPLSGPAYSTSFFEKDNQILLNIRPVLFSSVGGAGIVPMDGLLTQIQRSAYTVNTDEIKKRKIFQEGFTNF